MKKMKFAVIAFSVLFALKTNAQENVKVTSPSLSIAVDGAIPTGDFKSGYKMGLGADAKLAIPVVTDGFVTVSGGFLSFPGKDFAGYKLPTATLIPLKAGFQYRFPGGLYLEPQLGYSILKVKGESGSDGAFTYAGNIGFLVNNMIDLSARYEASSKDGGTTSFIGLRVGYNFGF